MPTLSDAISTIKAGRRDEGRVMLTQILAQDRNNVTALLWMTEFAATPEEVRMYLERVLAIDPTNAPARRGLERLDKADKPLPLTATAQLPTSQPTLADTANNQRMSPDEKKPQRSTKVCPYCWKTISVDSSICRFCGRALAATTTVELAGAPTKNTSNVDTVTGIIIVFLIIVVLFWVVIGFAQIRTVYLGKVTAYDLTDADVNQLRLLTLVSIFCFALAVANLAVAKGVMQHHRSAYRQLIGLAATGGVGAFILALIGSPSAIIGVPLCIIVAYLASTIGGEHPADRRIPKRNHAPR